MASNSSETNTKGSSRYQGLMIVIVLLIFLCAINFFKPTVIVLASIVILGSITVGAFRILHSYSAGDAKSQAISGEIELMSNDASFDISEELIIWDKLKYTKGIDTRMEGQDRDIEDIHRRLVIARDELVQATTPVHRIEAVLAADSVLAIARELRKPAQF